MQVRHSDVCVLFVLQMEGGSGAATPTADASEGKSVSSLEHIEADMFAEQLTLLTHKVRWLVVVKCCCAYFVTDRI